MNRCCWAESQLMIAYHDQEWGRPQHDDRTLFEFLILEGAQAGLSWETILKKRSNYREAFAREHRNRPQSPQDKGGHHKRARISRCAGRIRQLRCLHLEIRQRASNLEHPLIARTANPHVAIGRLEQGSVTPRFQVCWHDDLLRLHASYRSGK